MPGKCADIEDRRRRLDHRPDLGRGRAAGVESGGDVVERGERVDLGDDHGRRPGGSRGSEIVAPPLGGQPVAADRQQAAAVVSRRHGGDGSVARVGLGVGSDSVLEIEDDRVAWDRFRFRQRPRVGGGHVQDRAQQRRGHSA